MRVTQNSCAMIAALACASGAFAVELHNEAVDGDLSNDRFNPTAFSLVPGSNTLAATSSDGDREFITLTLPAGMQLDLITLNAFDTKGDIMFMGFASGPVMPVDPDSPDPAGLLGWAYFGPPVVPLGGDILEPMTSGFGSQGFSIPLQAGVYTFWIQQLTGPTSYEVDFVVSVVPAPGAFGVIALAGISALRRRR